ncbi:conserved hypothetical protein [Ricinus communis]|uniref:Uncharacterized protein n=1 Tax=Ricinus communis TaxID=3988 RepID=B9R977_RICCO|nr:conserved hypothetical protein [Ricinus communis]
MEKGTSEICFQPLRLRKLKLVGELNSIRDLWRSGNQILLNLGDDIGRLRVYNCQRKGAMAWLGLPGDLNISFGHTQLHITAQLSGRH